jgi:o-succinylbenzoate synthase
MRIAEVSYRRFSGLVGPGVGNARTRWARRDGYLLTLKDDRGNAGVGEVSTLPEYSQGMECDPVRTRVEVSEALEGATVPDGADSVAEIVRRLGETASIAAIRFAAESAALDLVGQQTGRAVTDLLGGFARVTVPRCGLIAVEPGEWVSAARGLAARGIGTIKIKVGRAGSEAEELAQLKAVRAVIPESTRLRLDANGVWDLDEARRRLESFTAYDVEYVEQPVSPGRLPRLGQCAVPWAADESLADDEEAAQLLDSPCAAFVLKPAILGGLTKCLDLARRAASKGIASVASHLFDGPVALAAYCELALALPGPVAACGIDVHPGLSLWPAVTVPQLQMDTDIVRGTRSRSGLGFSTEDRQALASQGYTV